MSTQLKPYSKAEIERLKAKAAAANAAIREHSEFVEFLREQHDAPEEKGWTLGLRGFELPPGPGGNDSPPTPQYQNGNSAGGIEDEVAQLMQQGTGAES